MVGFNSTSDKMPETKLTINGRKNVRLNSAFSLRFSTRHSFLASLSHRSSRSFMEPDVGPKSPKLNRILSHAIPVLHTLQPTVHKPHDDHVRNAKEAHEQDVVANDVLLLSTLKAFEQCPRSPRTSRSAGHFQFACTTHSY